VNVVDVDAPRVPVISRTAGIMFGVRHQRLVKPGDIMIKVAGKQPLPWRVGNLLTAK
jgi:predicted deacylase